MIGRIGDDVAEYIELTEELIEAIDDYAEYFAAEFLKALKKGDGEEAVYLAGTYPVVMARLATGFTFPALEPPEELRIYLRGINIFPAVYFQLEISPRETLEDELFGKCIADLREGLTSDIPLIRMKSGEFLNRICDKISRPTTLEEWYLQIDRRGSFENPKSPYSNEQLLQEYEWLLQKIQKVCKGTQGLRREEIVKRNFPEIAARCKRGVFKNQSGRNDWQPRWIAFNILSERHGIEPDTMNKAVILAFKI